MVPVWEMTKRLWFTDKFVEAENAVYHEIKDVFIATPVEGYLGGTSAVADLNYLDSLNQITTNTRIIAAGDDPVTPIERSEEMHERIKNSKLFIIDGQRHFSNIESPRAFNKLLRDGLDEMAS